MHAVTAVLAVASVTSPNQYRDTPTLVDDTIFLQTFEVFYISNKRVDS